MPRYATIWQHYVPKCKLWTNLCKSWIAVHSWSNVIAYWFLVRSGGFSLQKTECIYQRYLYQGQNELDKQELDRGGMHFPHKNYNSVLLIYTTFRVVVLLLLSMMAVLSVYSAIGTTKWLFAIF